MSVTYSYQDALNVARQQYRNATDQTILPYALKMAIGEMWVKWDWRDSIAVLPPFWLVPGVQDYGVPFVSVPSNFYGLREVYLMTLNVSPVPVLNNLRVVSNLEQTGLLGLPNTICYRSSVQSFRVHPAPGLSVACPQYMIVGTYKTNPPTVGRDDVQQPLAWDDQYFATFVQFLVWAAKLCSGETDAAAKQKMIAMASLAEAAQSANTEDGDPIVAPTEGLTQFGYGGSGYFPGGALL